MSLHKIILLLATDIISFMTKIIASTPPMVLFYSGPLFAGDLWFLILECFINLKNGAVSSFGQIQVDHANGKKYNSSKETKACCQRCRSSIGKDSTHNGSPGPVAECGQASCLTTVSQGEHFRANNPHHWTPRIGKTNDIKTTKDNDHVTHNRSFFKAGKDCIHHQSKAHENTSSKQESGTTKFLNGSNCNKSGKEIDDIQNQCSNNSSLCSKEFIKDNGSIKHDGIDTRKLLDALQGNAKSKSVPHGVFC
mmetsp:Transcript_8907/g.14297  ORF Transcript_8907/g.14297 Transcript_8907/m.14297 type:complete len:251 (-) Transcript_8907:1003-1755(-)